MRAGDASYKPGYARRDGSAAFTAHGRVNIAFLEDLPGRHAKSRGAVSSFQRRFGNQAMGGAGIQRVERQAGLPGERTDARWHVAGVESGLSLHGEFQIRAGGVMIS